MDIGMADTAAIDARIRTSVPVGFGVSDSRISSALAEFHDLIAVH
jgi:hypothetical protein